MPGPAVAVLLKRSLDSEGIDWIHDVVRNVSCSSRGDLRTDSALNFEVDDASRLGIACDGEKMPFQLSLQPLTGEYGEDELDAMRDGLGWLPQQEMMIVAFVRRESSSLIVAELASRLARRFGGMVNLASPVAPRGQSWQGWPEKSRSFAASVPGKIIEVSYGTGEGQKWFYHLVDADYLDNWRKSPDFWLALSKQVRRTNSTLLRSSQPDGAATAAPSVNFILRTCLGSLGRLERIG